MPHLWTLKRFDAAEQMFNRAMAMDPPPMRQPRSRVENLVFNIALSVASASLSINAYLVKERVSDMTSTLKEISSKIGDLREEQASVKNQVVNNTAAIGQLQRRH